MTTDGSPADRPSVSALLTGDPSNTQVEFFRSILNSVPGGIAILDGATLCLKWANLAFLELVSGASLGAPLPAGFARSHEILSLVARSGSSFADPEYLYRDPVRGVAYWRLSTMPLPTLGRPLPDVVLAIDDVTEQVRSRHRMEELAAEAEGNLQKLGAVVTSLAEGLVIAESDGSITNMNPAALKMYGVASLEDLRGPFELTARIPIHRVLQGESISGVEIRSRNPGSREWIGSWNGTPIFGKDGKIQLAVLTVRDITQRHEAEAALEDSEERYRKMGDLIPFGFWVADPHGMMTYLNDSFLDLTGTTLEECRGLGWANLVHPDERERTLSRWKQCVESDTFWDHEHRVRGKNGEYCTLLSRGVPIRGDDGKIRSWAGINLDVTDRKRFITELREAKEIAEAASRSKDEFLSVISHELRTPLNPILAAVQMLAQDQSLSVDVRAWVDIIRRNAELEARLIDDMLDLTRIFRGTLQLNVEPVNLHSVIENVLDICRSQLLEKNLRLDVDLRATDARVSGDPGRLQQVFWNLLKNAVKFTDVGGAITVRSANEGGSISVSVMDTGIGIEPEAISRVFGAFEREGESVTRLFGGLGLGLSITKALVEMHGGKIAAMSDGRDRGSAFTVRLETRMVETNAQESPPSKPSQAVRILLVDDHRDTCTLMKSMLVRRGYDVMTAETVGGALQLVEDNEFDLLVSDLGLPDASGLELMQKIRETRAMRGIALTGFGRDEDVKKSKEAGFSEHMTKPVNIPKLEAAIRRLTAVAGQKNHA